MKPWVRTLLAFLVVGGLAVWIGVNELTPVEEKKDRMWKVKPDSVVGFEVKDLVSGVGLACEKRDGGWRIASAGGLEADAEACELAVKHLAEPEVERKLEAPEDLSVYGLHAPKFRAAFTDKSGKTRVMLIGLKTPTDNACFVLEEGSSTPFTVATWSVDNFRKTVADLREKTLMRLEPADVRRLVIRRKTGGTIELKREDAERWSLVKPVTGAADRFTVDAILNDLKTLKGTEVIEDRVAFSRFRLDQPGAEVVAFTGTGSGQTLTLSQPKAGQDAAYASSTRLPFTWKLGSAAIVAAVVKPLDDFRERLLLQLDKESLTGAEVTVGGRRHVLTVSAKGAWTVTEPAGAGSLGEELTDLIFELVYVRAEAFVDDSPKPAAKYGLAPPRAEVVLRATVDRKPVTYAYRLGTRGGDHVHCAFGDRPGVVGVRKELLDKLERFADKVRAGPTPPPPAKKP